MQWTTERRALVTFAVLVGAGALARFLWSDEHSPTPASRAPLDEPEPTALALALGVDAAALVASPVDPSPPAGDLAGEASHFTTLAACVDQRAHVDPLVGDSLRAIGYDTFLRDSCRILEALHEKDRAPCALISSTPLRLHCEVTVAIAVARPDDCPVTPGALEIGRDPFCVAVAARDPRLCAGSPSRARCEAVLTRKEARCPRGGSEGSDCARDVLRMGPLVTGELVAGAPFSKPEATLVVTTNEDADAAAPLKADLHREVERGVVLVKARDRYVIDLGQLGRSAFAAPPLDLRVALRVSGHGKGEGALEQLELDVPPAARIMFPDHHVTFAVTFAALDTKRGGAVDLAFDGTANLGDAAFSASFHVVTFVRDVVQDDSIARLTSPFSDGPKRASPQDRDP